MERITELSSIGVNIFFKYETNKLDQSDQTIIVSKHSDFLLEEYFIFEGFSDILMTHTIIMTNLLEHINQKYENNKINSTNLRDLVNHMIEIETDLFNEKSDKKNINCSDMSFDIDVNKFFNCCTTITNITTNKYFNDRIYFTKLNNILTNPDNLSALKYYLIICFFRKYGVYDNEIKNILCMASHEHSLKNHFVQNYSIVFVSDFNKLFTSSVGKNFIQNIQIKRNTVYGIFRKIITTTKNFFKNKKWLTNGESNILINTINLIKLEFSYDDINYQMLNISDRKSFLDNITELNKFIQIKKSNKNNVCSTLAYTKSAYVHVFNNIVRISDFFLDDEIIGTTLAENYGSIGIIIAHEIGHIVDYVLSKKIKSNYYLTEKNKLLLQFDNYIHNGYKLNGTKTLNENIAEYFGWLLAISTLKTYTNNTMSFDTFFKTYTKMRCVKKTNTCELLSIFTDTHSLDAYRINGTIQHINEFYTTYQINKNDKMYLPQELRITL